MWSNPIFITLKTIVMFLLIAIALKHCNKAEASEIKLGEPAVTKEREYIPEVKKSTQGYVWRCETWNKKESYGWGEHNILEYAAIISMSNCSKTPNGENCSSTPICRYNKPYDRNSI